MALSYGIYMKIANFIFALQKGGLMLAMRKFGNALCYRLQPLAGVGNGLY